MAHAGTIDLGRQAQRANGRNPWLAVATVLALAAIAVMYLGTASGLTSGNLAAKPAADRSYDQIEAQRGALALPVAVDRSYDPIETHRTELAGLTNNRYDLVYPLPARIAVPATLLPGTQMTSGTFHTGLPIPAAPELTSGTFHPGLPVVAKPFTPRGNLKSFDNPVNRDRIGGP